MIDSLTLLAVGAFPGVLAALYYRDALANTRLRARLLRDGALGVLKGRGGPYQDFARDAALALDELSGARDFAGVPALPTTEGLRSPSDYPLDWVGVWKVQWWGLDFLTELPVSYDAEREHFVCWGDPATAAFTPWAAVGRLLGSSYPECVVRQLLPPGLVFADLTPVLQAEG